MVDSTRGRFPKNNYISAITNGSQSNVKNPYLLLKYHSKSRKSSNEVEPVVGRLDRVFITFNFKPSFSVCPSAVVLRAFHVESPAPLEGLR